MGKFGQNDQPPGSFRGGPPPGSFRGGTPPGSFRGGAPPNSFPVLPGTTPPGSMQPGTMAKGKGKGKMPPGMQPPSSYPGAIGSGLVPPGSQQFINMMKAGVIEPGKPPLGVEQASKWERMDSIVGEYQPLYPSPETPVYMVFAKDTLTREAAMEERFCSKLPSYGTMARANLMNSCDLYTMSWRQRMENPWQWVYAHASGWEINFWPWDFFLNKSSDDSAGNGCRPIASLDIRQICVAQISEDKASAEGAKCPWEVHINFANGYFPFRVKTSEEAQMWKGRIMQGVVENVKISQRREKYMSKLHLHDEVEGSHIEKDPVRIERVAGLWHEAVEAVERGTRPSKEIFFTLYRIYDSIGVGQQDRPQGGYGRTSQEDDSGDSNLTMAEVEVMARELLEIKMEEVKQITVQQEKVLYSNHRPVNSVHEVKLRWTIDQGRALMKYYEQMLSPKDFFDRVVNFHQRTDISREGKVDINEFMLAAPVFLMPVKDLRKEGMFFRSAMMSDPKAHAEAMEEHARHQSEGRTREEADADCNQQ